MSRILNTEELKRIKHEHKEKTAKARRQPPVIIALNLNDAAAAISVSVPYLKQAIEAGKLKATVKRAPGKGRGITRILVRDLEKFITEDENVADDGQLADAA